MISRNLIPTALALTLLSTSAFAYPILPPLTVSGSVASTSAAPAQAAPPSAVIVHAYRSLPGYQAMMAAPPAAHRATVKSPVSCAALEARFDQDLKRPLTQRTHQVADAAALFREGGALCRQGNFHAGTVYLKGAVNALLARHVV